MGNIPRFDLVNPYDILAMLIARVQDLSPEFYSNSAIRNTIDISEDCAEAVDLFIRDHPEFSNPYMCLSEGIPERIKTDIVQWPYYGRVLYVYNLLRRIARIFSWSLILRSSPVAVLKEGFSSLNSNVQETGIRILPRVPAINDDYAPSLDNRDGSECYAESKASKLTWSSTWNYGINCDLSNIYYLEEKQLTVGTTHYQTNNIILSNPDLSNRARFRIAVSPIARDVELDIRKGEREVPGGTQRLFTVKGIKNSRRAYARIAAAYLCACEGNADCLVFAEMLADDQIATPKEEYSHLYSFLSLKALGLNLLPLPLCIGPTMWIDGRNEAHIFDANGRRLCIQRKQNPFNYVDKETGKSWVEDLKSPEPIVQVLHIPHLGRITIPICRDLLVSDYRDMLVKVIQSTIAICPSYSHGKTMFDLVAPRDRSFGCYVIWANTCSAYINSHLPDHIGLVSSPIPVGSETLFKLSCEGNCGGDTKACLFWIDIPLLSDKPKAEVSHFL